ncbi:helix-loop-helix domain-containing protein [Endozoicomonas sp. ALC013]|uniref:helix-loop-helix domain-containing protein n=1 Tax=Endozoicomonas sp. ALC013 TaxID=3403076 RepID=UPI003BB71788
MNINTTKIQPNQTPSDESSGAIGINPAKDITFKQFDVHQVDHRDVSSTSTARKCNYLTKRNRPRMTYDQHRRMASLRVKHRVSKINDAFLALKNKIPGGAEQSLTKVQILRQACVYIRALEQQLRNPPGPF